MTEEREESRIQWHPAFYAATKLELRDNIDELEFYPEYNLSKKPLQADLLIIEKNSDVQIKNVIGHIFRKHNIVEYKSPGDGMTVDDFYKCVAYACLYKSTGENVNAIAGDELSITMIRESYPKSMMRELKRLGIGFVKYEAGIYHSRNIFIPAQLIVTQELKPDEHRSLRILSRKADEKDVKGFIKETLGYVTQGEKADAQAVLKVSGTANYHVYEKIRSESDMRNFLDEIKNEGFNEGKSQGLSQGLSQGRTEALEQTAMTLFDMGMAVDKIAQAVHTSVNIVEEWLSVKKCDTAK